MEADELLHLIDNLEDERSRARVREGIYISLLAHVLIFLWLLFGPRYILHRPKVVSPFDVLTDRQKKELTYMTLPPDALKQIRPKNPQALSDKNRVAQSPHPTLDKKTLEQLQAMRRAGPPAPQPAPQQQPAPTPAAGSAAATTAAASQADAFAAPATPAEWSDARSAARGEAGADEAELQHRIVGRRSDPRGCPRSGGAAGA